AKNKRKSEDNARNNQNQQPNKRQNTGQAYTAGNGDRRLYAGSRPLCSKCNYNMKIVRVLFEDETLIIRCDGSNKGNQLNIISCTKTRKYLLKRYPVFLVNITTKTINDKSKEKQLEDVPIVPDFSEVFLEDLPGLPPTRQVEFQIDLIPGAAPVAR
nr:reverse transcriptase domain-containing protein [Tanacetum cinerariifolium]